MFRELVGLPAGSPEFQRHRVKIVQRCLPLADLTSRGSFGSPANRVTTLFRSRVGLVNAAVRFDVNQVGLRLLRGSYHHGEVKRPSATTAGQSKVPGVSKELHLRQTATADLSQRLGRAPWHRSSPQGSGWTALVHQGLLAGSSCTPCPSTAVAAGDAMPRNLFAWMRVLTRSNQEVLVRCSRRCPVGAERCLVLRFFDSMTQTQIASASVSSQMHVSRLLVSHWHGYGISWVAAGLTDPGEHRALDGRARLDRQPGDGAILMRGDGFPSSSPRGPPLGSPATTSCLFDRELNYGALHRRGTASPEAAARCAHPALRGGLAPDDTDRAAAAIGQRESAGSETSTRRPSISTTTF